MNEYSDLLPRTKDITRLLRLHSAPSVAPLFEATLLRPIGDFLNASGKRLRTQILDFGFDAADAGRTPAEVAAERREKGAFIIEALHAASLVIDDIEDGSLERRGAPTLHRQVGMPVALNAGTWLYFWPLEKIASWGLTPTQELRLYRLCINALLRAHCGQAIDLGVGVDTLPQEKVLETSLAAMELKTGAFMGLAAALGGALADADDPTLEWLRDFGVAFGVALQMFDDIGNLAKPGSKQYEDLKLRRPSWIWACAAQGSGPEDYQAFLEAVWRLPDASALELWLQQQALVIRAKSLAIEHLDRAFGPLEERLGPERLTWVREVGERLREAYE